MRSLTFALPAVVAVALASCGGGSDDAEESLPEITLITTTTSLAPFEPSDSVPASDVAPEQTVPSTPVTEPPPVTVPPTTAAPETTVAPETTATTAPPLEGFTLETDGLGSVSFGADPDGVIAFVTSFLGAATADTGWVDPFTVGACGGTQLRQVSWGDLQLEFGDVSSITDGRPHFYAYFYGREGISSATPPGLATGQGITVGSTVAALLQAYPGVQLRSGDEFMNDSFFVNDNLTGRLSGLADPDVVELIIGGIPCNS
jgi:hypothetical protein